MQSVIRLSNIQRQHLPYVLGWVLHYAWVLVFATIHMGVGSLDAVFAHEARYLIHPVLLVSAALTISILKREWFVRLLRFCAPLLLVLLLLYLVAPMTPIAAIAPMAPAPYAPVIFPAFGVLFGAMSATQLIPFAFILNNTEKLYALLLGSFLAGIYALVFQTGWMAPVFQSVLAFILLCVAVVPLYFYRVEHFDQATRLIPASKAPPIVFLTLFVNLLFALVVLGVGKELLDTLAADNQSYLYGWFFSGTLAACAVCLLVFMRARESIQVIWNITFAVFVVAALIFSLLGENPGAARLLAVLVGLAITTGSLNMYHNVGVIAKKYHNMNYIRLPLWFGVIGGMFFVAVAWLFTSVASSTFVAVVIVLCSVLVLVYFVALPVLTRVYFADTWVEDSALDEVDAPMLEVFAHYGFSNRETQVCRLLLEGYTLRQTAAALKISQATVNTYCTAIYRKAGVNSKIQLLKLFTRQ